MSDFHFSELAGLAGQPVNRMRHFEGMALQNLEINIITPKTVCAVWKKFEGQG